ncbi:MAG: acetyl-CoA hydrolase/transferase family protein [Anaerovoracaceae bacterium]
MDWREKYKDKIVSAKEAAKVIKDGDKIVSQQLHLSAEPVIDAICDRAKELKNVDFFSSKSFGKEAFLNEEYKDSFGFSCIFLGETSRVPYYEHRAKLIPLHYHQLPMWLKDEYKPNVLLCVISEPDENGMSSLSLNADYTDICVDICDTVIAQVNKYAPKSFGNQISLDQIDYIVEDNTPLVEVHQAVFNETSLKISQHIEPYIQDGSCIQLGIGSIPDAVCSLLHGKKDLGVHTELFSDGIVDLYNEGVITGKKKQIDVGKIVTNTICGSKKVFDFVNNNPDVLIKPVEYTNNPYIIQQNDNMISINGCVEVDLMGQVVSDTVNGKAYSGIGGQVDFVRGSQASKNGKSFLALPSTAAKGKKSRIVCQIEKGTPITTSRFDVQYLVTEFGCVNVRGLDTRERAEAIISIAHPDFRDQLRKEAIECGLIW